MDEATHIEPPVGASPTSASSASPPRRPVRSAPAQDPCWRTARARPTPTRAARRRRTPVQDRASTKVRYAWVLLRCKVAIGTASCGCRGRSGRLSGLLHQPVEMFDELLL